MIIIDADACPRKDAVIKLAREYNTEVLLVASYAHRMPEGAGITVRYTDSSPQAVDLVIMNAVKRGDIVITQDYGLAAVVLAKGAITISPRGQEYTNENIGGLLEIRNLHARVRRGGGKTKGPAAYTNDDEERLIATLQKFLILK